MAEAGAWQEAAHKAREDVRQRQGRARMMHERRSDSKGTWYDAKEGSATMAARGANGGGGRGGRGAGGQEHTTAGDRHNEVIGEGKDVWEDAARERSREERV